MGDAKHTPAPWGVDFGEATKIKAADGTVATAAHIHLRGRRTPEEVAANARLIAAAPELLEALDGLLDAITAENQHRDRALTITGPTANLKWLLEACDDARAAIAKAEGRE